MSITHEAYLNIVPGDSPAPIIKVSQYDADFSIVFHLIAKKRGIVPAYPRTVENDEDVTINVPKSATVSVRGTKTDGNGYSANATLSGTATAPIVTVAGHEQMTASAGVNVYEITFYADNATKRLSTANFILFVEPAALDASTITSESLMLELNDLIASVPNAVAAADRAEAAAQSVEGVTTQVATNTQDISDIKAELSEISEVHGSKTIDVYEYVPISYDLPTYTETIRDIKFTPQSDGSVSVVGSNTSTSRAIYTLKDANGEKVKIQLTEGKTYRLTGGLSDNLFADVRRETGGGLWTDKGKGVIFTVQETGTYCLAILVSQNTTVNDVVKLEISEQVVVGQETVDVLTAKDDVARDGKVDKQQGVENAGKTLVVRDDGLVGLADDSGSGLSNAAKAALLACFKHVSWLDNDADYYGTLESALDVVPERTLQVTFEPGNHIVYADDTLDTLTPYLTVTYRVGSVETVISSENYTLIGDLQIGNNSINVSYEGLSATFNVTAVDLYNIFRWEYKADGSGNLLKHVVGMYDKIVTSDSKEIAVGILTGANNSAGNRRSWYVRKGKLPAYLSDGTQTNFYPIPVPPTAKKYTATMTPSTDKMAVYLYKYTESPVYENYHYERINDAGMKTGTITETFTPGNNLFISILHRPAGGSYTQEPEFTIVFE